jgi:hypothetical protein
MPTIDWKDRTILACSSSIVDGLREDTVNVIADDIEKALKSAQQKDA